MVCGVLLDFFGIFDEGMAGVGSDVDMEFAEKRRGTCGTENKAYVDVPPLPYLRKRAASNTGASTLADEGSRGSVIPMRPTKRRALRQRVVSSGDEGYSEEGDIGARARKDVSSTFCLAILHANGLRQDDYSADSSSDEGSGEDLSDTRRISCIECKQSFATTSQRTSHAETIHVKEVNYDTPNGSKNNTLSLFS